MWYPMKAKHITKINVQSDIAPVEVALFQGNFPSLLFPLLLSLCLSSWRGQSMLPRDGVSSVKQSSKTGM